MQYYNKAKMTSDNIFTNALIASIVVHIFILVPMPHMSRIVKVKIPQEPELTYQPDRKIPIDSKLISEKPTEKPVLPAKAEKLQEQQPTGAVKQAAIKAESAQKNPSKTTTPIKPESLEKIQAHEKSVPGVHHDTKSDFPMPDFSKDSILIADDKKDFSSDPIYLDYYNAVRSQIYKSAQAHRPYHFMEGGVSLIFTLSRDGRLIGSSIIKEKSTKNPILQRHALASIEYASPFSPFHESMKEQELTLRITISFEK
jgi:TonB family protein